MHKISGSRVCLILILALFLRLTILNRAEIFGARPDVILISVVFVGLFSGWGAGLWTGLAAGLLCDVFTFDIFWINTLILGATGFTVGALSAKFFRESKATQFLVVFFSSALSMSARLLISSYISPSLRINPYSFFAGSALPAALYTAVLSVPLFSAFTRFYRLREDEGLL